jgi:hypothetical protein
MTSREFRRLCLMSQISDLAPHPSQPYPTLLEDSSRLSMISPNLMASSFDSFHHLYKTYPFWLRREGFGCRVHDISKHLSRITIIRTHTRLYREQSQAC